MSYFIQLINVSLLSRLYVYPESSKALPSKVTIKENCTSTFATSFAPRWFLSMFPLWSSDFESLLTLLLLYEVCVLKGCAKQTTAIITHKSAMLLWMQLCQKVVVTLTHESVIKIVTAELRNNIENSKPWNITIYIGGETSFLCFVTTSCSCDF